MDTLNYEMIDAAGRELFADELARDGAERPRRVARLLDGLITVAGRTNKQIPA